MQKFDFENIKNIRDIENENVTPLRLIQSGSICEATGPEVELFRKNYLK